MKVNGSNIKAMEKEYIGTKMVPDTLVNGKMICRMVKVKKSGLMGQDIEVTIKKVKNVDKGNLNGQMVPNIMESLGKIILRGLEFIYGPIKDNMKECERKIRCMDEGYSNGLMDGNILAIILMIKKKERDYLNGRIVRNILVSEWLGNNMEKECLLQAMGKKNMGNERLVLDRDGL